MEQELIRLEQEIKSFKTNQKTRSDSALLYRQTFTPSVSQGVTRWKITCISGINPSRTIFMPCYQDGLANQMYEATPAPLGSEDGVFYLEFYKDSVSDSGLQAMQPQGFTVYSNVEFFMTTEQL